MNARKCSLVSRRRELVSLIGLFPIVVALGVLSLWAAGCPSQVVIVPDDSPTLQPTTDDRAFAPVEHFGPVVYAPAIFDCGYIPELDHCRFGVTLENGGDPVTIVRIRQDVSAYGRVGLVEDDTGFDRDLPYDMRAGEVLRLLFELRRDDPNETLGGAVYLEYESQGRDFEVVVPVRVEMER